MEWINYHHLLYFWTVAREGGVARAAEALHLAQPTVSAQIRELERSFGAKLFDKAGRNLVLSETGRTVFRYADEIFSLGRELQDAVKGRPTGRPLRLAVGAADALPKLVVHRLLEPALRLPEPVQLVCHEGKADQLLARLALHELDIVLSDAPPGPTARVRVFSHLLGECGLSFFAAAGPARSRRRRFPASLTGAPMLLPMEGTALRRALDQWLDKEGLRPVIRGEFADSALLKVFGQMGAGVFAAPTVIEAEVMRQYGVRLLGRVAAVRERFYAVSVEKRLRHPAVVAITEAARSELFASPPPG